MCLYIGDLVHIGIEARDRYNQTRFVGGDFWFTWLSSKKNPVASTAGSVTDYDNGTYKITFLAAWSGHADINIILVHSSDATQYLRNIVWNTENRIFWIAVYQNQTLSQNSKCVIMTPGVWENKCVYPSPIANGRSSLVCDKPTNLSCDALLKYKADNERIKKEAEILIKGKEFLFQR